ncbi:GreA/GreB family elongation factor [Bacillus sp. Marseille-Q3570]|uniref:GreA/GreB family elongation factor n=1 Tax=Bacillus sp. Marseille-Q3570 TaxID=2963522 RepID=UPI0021B753B9|nr:GreA/GreB family elongation factor [Bacillus sp. Marseille-Q3570]
MSHDSFQLLKKSLIEQLTYIDENHQELLDLYLTTIDRKNKDFQFFKRYASVLKEYMLTIDNTASSKLTKVFIGSQVSVLYEDDNEVDHYTICFPGETDPDKGYISFHSPVGSQLLYRCLGEKMILITPNGETSVVIKDINYFNGYNF